MKTAWIYPFIVFGGVLQTFGAAMNAQLYASLENRWLASAVSFAIITTFFLCVFLMFPAPLPNSEKLFGMPWWAPLGGLVGAVQVYAGLTLVQKVGAGPLWASRSPLPSSHPSSWIISACFICPYGRSLYGGLAGQS